MKPSMRSLRLYLSNKTYVVVVPVITLLAMVVVSVFIALVMGIVVGLPLPAAAEEVRAFALDREILSERTLGRILSATIRGQVTPQDEDRAAASRISLEPVSLQDLIAALGIHTLTSAFTQENR